jgi:pimeloyl-ACP methyl ester carboxylesterase
LIKPDGFTGEITVTTVGSATRGDLADPGLRLPPGLADLRDDFQLVGQPGTRGIGSTGFVFGLDVDDTARQLVSPDNPLRVEFSNLADDVTDLWPVIFDGEDYILGGYASESGNAVDLVSLPRPVAPTDAAGRPTTRGLGRTLRLFIFKKLGRHIPDLGLRRAELTNGEVVYRPVTSDEFRPGQRAAVFVHGLISDSRWMIQTPAEFLRRTVRYDHLLTWDYETFGTGVEANGAQLALALQQQCGFGPGDEIGLDVYAHSMGTLVSRCMIELSGGAGFVDRAVLAGPPNRGSTLATTGRLLPFLVTSLVNRVSGIPILGAVSWTLKQIFEQGVGLADLAVDSPIVTRLNALDKPSNVPYLVLAGENRLDPAEATRLKRLAEKVLDAGLDTIFGEQNDIAIGLSSMQALRGGAYPLLTTKVLPCDHFHYYAIPDGQEAISRWLTETTPAVTTQG